MCISVLRRWGVTLFLPFLLFVLPVLPRAIVRAQDERALAFFSPVRGAINDATPIEDWDFAGSTNQVISLLVVGISGNLDPALQVIGPDGTVIAENDDRDSLVRDAGLEALTLPDDGVYTIRVTRYGSTVGQYELTVSPGLTQLVRRDMFNQGDVSWVTPQGDLVPLAQGKLQMRINTPGETLIAFPPDARPLQNLYFEADARLLGTPGYAEFGLVFRAQGTQSYQFKINTDGQWTVLAQQGTSVYALRNWQSHPELTGSGWTLAVLARDDNFSFYANGVLLGTLSDDRLSAAGSAGVMVANRVDETEATTVLFDDVVITKRLASTYNGLPLALTDWSNDDPDVVTAELATSGQLTLAPTRDLFISDADLTAPVKNAFFELLGSDQTIYNDFILSAWVTIVTSGTSAGCGMVYRWQDERNLDLAYVDVMGGFGVVQAHDAQLTTNAYDLSPMIRPGEANNLLIIAQDDHVTLYINGALVTQETVTPGAGRVGISLLNYDTARTDCYWTNIWVWPLQP
jgi:hypothetical protein